MENSNIEIFNEQLTRAIGRLYEAHPSVVTLGSDELWASPLSRIDEIYSKKSAISGGTLTWLYRNEFVGGKYDAVGDGCIIFGAQLTSSGYRIAHKKEGNYRSATLGEVAIAAITTPEQPSSKTAFSLIASRFTGT